MSKMKKMLSLLLAVVMLTSMLVGCGAKESGGSGGDKSEPLSFSVMTVDFGEDPTGKLIHEEWLNLMEEKMGREINIDWQFVPMNDYGTKLQLVLSSGKIPDVITLWDAPADLYNYVDDGILLDVAEYLDRLPVYKSWLDASPEATSASLYNAEGKMAAFWGARKDFSAVGGSHTIYGTYAFRKDLFDQHNIPYPQTIDDIYTAAKTLKEIYPDKYPIMQMEEWNPVYRSLLFSHNVEKGMYYDETTAKYGPIEDGYKEALMVANKWYEEGLVSPEYTTMVQADGQANLAAGDAMIIPVTWYGYPGMWATQYPEQEWVLAPFVYNPEYDRWIFEEGYKNDLVVSNTYDGIAINAQSEVLDDILTFMDYYYSEDVTEFLAWGIEGKTYTVNEAGEKEFLYSGWDELNSVALYQGDCRAAIFPQVQSQLVMMQFQTPQNFLLEDGSIIEATPGVFIRDYYSDDATVPATRFVQESQSEEFAEEYANIMTPIETYAAEQTEAFINGTRSFDEWDDYVKEIKSMGDLDRAIEMWGTLYNKRKNP